MVTEELFRELVNILAVLVEHDAGLTRRLDEIRTAMHERRSLALIRREANIKAMAEGQRNIIDGVYPNGFD